MNFMVKNKKILGQTEFDYEVETKKGQRVLGISTFRKKTGMDELLQKSLTFNVNKH